MNRSAIALMLALVCAGAACSPGGKPGSTGANPPAAAPAAAPPTATPPAAVPSATGAPAATATPASAPAEAKPQFREVTIPSGTPLYVKLATTVSSETSKVEDAVRGELTQPIVMDGTTVVPSGAAIRGSVLEATRSGRVKGRASVAIDFDRLSVGDETHDIRTARFAQEAKPTKREDAKKVGIGAAAGAVVGAIAGGKKGAAIGSGVGAGAGAGVVAATRGDEVQLPAGTTITTRLREPLTVRVPVR